MSFPKRYICPTCHSNAIRAPRTLSTVHYIKRARGDITALSSRPFHKSSASRADVQNAPDSPKRFEAEMYAPVMGSQNTIAPQKLSSKSMIRESLRAWSQQNESLKNQNIPDSIPAQGRVTQLPKHLFLETEDCATDKELEILELNDGSIDGGFVAKSQHLVPGALFTYTGKQAREQYAVYVCSIGMQTLLALENGCWVMERMKNMRNHYSTRGQVRVANFISPAEVEVLRQHMPKRNVVRPVPNSEVMVDVPMSGPMPSNVTASLQAKMRAFRTDVNTYQREFARTLGNGWYKIAHDTEYQILSLKDCLFQAFGIRYEELSHAQELAIMNELPLQDTITVFQTAETASVLVMPRRKYEEFQQVVEWARQYQDAAAQAALGVNVAETLANNPMTSFIDKARRLVLLSRKSRTPTENTGLGPAPSHSEHGDAVLKKVPTGVQFSSNDLIIIDYISTLSRIPTPRWRGPLRFLSTTTLIIRAIGAYPNLNLGPAVSQLLLKEIGCVDPWRQPYDMALPFPGVNMSKCADRLWANARELETDFMNSFYNRKDREQDSLAHLRRDWDSLPAFAIDKSVSKYNEDAVSIEVAKDGRGTWVHVHISHITAWFQPNSAVGNYARHQGMSCYSVDSSLPSGMLPASICQYFALKDGSPVLTISTLLSDDGTVEDVNISAGTLGKLIRLEMDDAQAVIGASDNRTKTASKLTVGPRPASDTGPASKLTVSPRPASDTGPASTKDAFEPAIKYKDSLLKLHDILQKRRRKREAELPQPVLLPRYSFDTQIEVHGVDAHDKTREHRSYHWIGDPHISVTASQCVGIEFELLRNHELVTQAMRLAAESTASWLIKRKIPAIFLGTEALADNSFEKIAQKQQHEQIRMPMFVRSSTPLPYWNIHLKSHCNITSPMRRYMDLVAMWQIDAYLQAEFEGHIAPGASIPGDKHLPFSKADIDDYLSVAAHAMDTIEGFLRMSKSNYVAQALFRAFHFKETTLPLQWEILIYESHRYDANLYEQFAKGYLIPFGLSTVLMPSTAGWERLAKHGQFLPVTINMIDTVRCEARCTAIGPPTDKQMFTTPFHASDITVDTV